MPSSKTKNRKSTVLYTLADADYLAGVSRGTAKRWLAGYRFRRSSGALSHRPPVTKDMPPFVGGVTFLDLVEVVAIGGLKDLGMTLREIRQIVENCQEVLNVQRPLVSLQFKVGGREVFVSHEGTLVEVLRGKGRRAWDEVLGPFIATLDYDDDLASRWWPLGKGAPVCVDPEYGYGYPVISRTGVRTEIVLERFQAGDTRDQISEDFNVSPSEVDGALRFEATRFKLAA
jgi:uncharacterized protein (DUF433 family)